MKEVCSEEKRTLDLKQSMEEEASQKRWPLLFASLLFAGISLLTGCLKAHPAKSIGQYQLDSQSDVTLLLPPTTPTADGTVQTTTLDFGDRSHRRSTMDEAALCSIRGRTFALSLQKDGRHWEFQAPSVKGWNTPSLYEEADQEWDAFLGEVVKRTSEGCFPKKMGVDAIQQRSVEAMSIPNGKILRFYYSLGSFGFVDLHLGMQIRVETTETGVSKKPAASGVVFSVEARSPVGVVLALASPRKHFKGSAKTMAVGLLSEFAEYPLLRLFLEQGATSSEAARPAILFGAKTQDVLNERTDGILRKGERGCDSTLPGSRCFLVSEGALSLLSSVTINGQADFYAPGTTLSQVLDVHTAYKPNSAFQTVTVQRRFGDHYAAISFPRTREAAGKLILLNGDRIRWN